MDFNELAKARKSTRAFTQQNLSKEQLTQLITAAQAAPSAGNCQPWHFFVVKDEAVKTEIMNKSYNQTWMLTAPVFIVVCADIKRTEGRYGERGVNLYCIQDTSAAIQNILLCAESMGLSTCWCGAFSEEGISEILNLQEDMRPLAIITVGYAAKESGRTKRRPIEEIMTVIGDN